MLNILLVEDDPFLVDIYKRKLESSGFRVTAVNRGDQVFRVLEQADFDLVLLDVVLPEVAGWEILRKIKNDDRYSKLKVAIFSNLGQPEEIAKGLKMGAVKYLVKSQFKPSEIVEQVNDILKGDCP